MARRLKGPRTPAPKPGLFARMKWREGEDGRKQLIQVDDLEADGSLLVRDALPYGQSDGWMSRKQWDEGVEEVFSTAPPSLPTPTVGMHAVLVPRAAPPLPRLFPSDAEDEEHRTVVLTGVDLIEGWIAYRLLLTGEPRGMADTLWELHVDRAWMPREGYQTAAVGNLEFAFCVAPTPSCGSLRPARDPAPWRRPRPPRLPRAAPRRRAWRSPAP